MARHTKYMIYVDKAVMENPAELTEAVIAHFIKKEVDMRDRKRFMAQVMRAHTKALQLEVIDKWIQVRDAATFPFRKDGHEDQGVEGGIPVDDGAESEPDSGGASDRGGEGDGEGDTGK